MTWSPIYKSDPPAARALVELDGVTLIFHRPSGQTHIVASPAPEILAVLCEGEANAEKLLARLKRDYDFAESDGLEKPLAARLSELEAAGLVWRA